MAAPVLILLSIVIPSVTCFESKISVTCDDVPQHITVTLNTDTAFWGHLYASGNFNHPNCSVQGQGDRNLTLSIPFNSCDTTVDDKGIYLNKVTVQQHPTIVSSGDGQYNVACKMFVPNLNVETKSGMDVLGLPVDAFRPVNDSNLSSKSNSSLPQPKIILRVYDYQNDVFVDTVRLGQVVELEVTIRDGNLYKGRVSDCDAFGGIDGKTIPVIRNLYLWKIWENGRIKVLSEGLALAALKDQGEAKKKVPIIIDYLTKHTKLHTLFVYKYILCEMLNFLNVVLQIYTVDAFLGGEFKKFGVKVLEFALMGDTSDKVHPMTMVFPRLTKCKFPFYGPSGDVIQQDTLCVLPLNVINEKVFVFAWFWYVILAAISALALVYRLVTILSPSMRAYCLKFKCYLVSDECMESVASHLPLGDWFMLYLLSKNVQPIFMREIMEDLNEMCIRECAHKNDALALEKMPREHGSKNNLIDDITYV